MRNYEVAYIASPDLDEESLAELQGQISGWIEAAGGEIVEVDRWGRRKLAYPIQDHRDGHYYFIYAQMPTSGPAAVEQDLQVSESVLRYMVVRGEDE